MSRRLWTLTHRYVGLVLAGFLLIAGLTGALLAFFNELDLALSPELMRVAPSDGRPPLDEYTLRQRLLAEHPDWSIAFVDLAPIAPDRAAALYVEGFQDDEVFVDPYTGRMVGSRSWGDLSQGLKNLMPFIYELHYSLALGIIGTYAFGIVAVLWFIDSFIGLYLTLPRPRREERSPQSASPGWWQRWKPAWLIRLSAGSYKLNFDLHRAGGLWVWAMLLVFAWSSVAFNLREVYNPVMRAFTDFPDEDAALPLLDAPRKQPRIDWEGGLAAARAAMAALGQQHRFAVREEGWFGYEADYGSYTYAANTSLDVGTELYRTQVWLDGDSGELLLARLPTGAHSGTTITTWLYSLHMGKVWGLPYRLFVCLVGVIVAMLSITGVIVWWRKRKAQSTKRSSRP